MSEANQMAGASRVAGAVQVAGVGAKFGDGKSFGQRREVTAGTKQKPVMFNGQVVGQQSPVGFVPPSAGYARTREQNASRWIVWFVAVAAMVAVGLWASLVFAQSAPFVPVSAQNWEQQALALAGTGLVALLGWLVTKANAYFAAHAKSAAAQYGANVFSRLAAQALVSVQAVEQLAQKDLAGGLNKANAASLKQDAMAYLKQFIGPQGLADLATIVGADQVAQVLSTHVEAAVLQVNQASAVAPLQIVTAAAK